MQCNVRWFSWLGAIFYGIALFAHTNNGYVHVSKLDREDGVWRI